MKTNHLVAISASIFPITLLIVPQTAYAYLDPGTGSMLLQGLIALIAGIVSTGAIYWRHMKDFARKIFRMNSKSKPSNESD
jgi:hypothetical protein